jgi:hypothetical protein
MDTDHAVLVEILDMSASFLDGEQDIVASHFAK